MNREECKKIIHILSASYPNWRIENPSDVVDAWTFMLSEYNYNDIAVAVKTYINTSNSAFAPSVSELIGMVHRPTELSQMSADEAWTLVQKAIKRSGYYSQEEFDKLPDLVKRVVVAPSRLKEWALDADFNAGVESSNFKKAYNNAVSQNNEISRMPTEARMKLQQLQNDVVAKIEAH